MPWPGHLTMIARKTNHPPVGGPAKEKRMAFAILRTLVKIVLASLVVGTIMAHFGITPEQLIGAAGLSTGRLEDLARQGLAWVWPNVLLGAMVIVPIWFLVFLLRPPGGQRSSE